MGGYPKYLRGEVDGQRLTVPEYLRRIRDQLDCWRRGGRLVKHELEELCRMLCDEMPDTCEPTCHAYRREIRGVLDVYSTGRYEFQVQELEAIHRLLRESAGEAND